MHTIRKATLLDLPALKILWTCLNGEERALQPVMEYPFAPTADVDAWVIEAAKCILDPTCHYIVAEKRSEIVGYMLSSVQTRVIGGPENFLFVHEHYVTAPERKRNGGVVADALQQETTRWGRSHNLTHVEINCVPGNVKRWEKLGFSTCAVRMYKEL